MNRSECKILSCENPATRKLTIKLPYSGETQGNYCSEHNPAGQIIDEQEAPIK